MRASEADRPFYRRPPETESEIFLFSLWRTMMRRRLLLILTFLGIVSLGVIGYFLWPTRYESQAELSYSFDSSDMVQLNDETLGSLGSNDAETKLATQVQILRNRDLVLAVVSKLDLARNSDFYKSATSSIDSSHLNPEQQEAVAQIFDHRLSVRIVPKTYLVTVAYRNRSPQLAQKILSELLSEYIQRSFEARYLDTEQSADWLQKQIDGLRTDVENKERRLVQLQQQNGLLLMGLGMSSGSNDGSGGQGTSVQTTASVQLGEVIRAYVAGEADRINKEALYRASLTGDPEMLASIMPESKIGALRQQQAALNGTLASLTSQYGPQYPDVVAAKAQLSEVNTGIRKEVANLQEQLREQYLAAQRGEDLLKKTEGGAERDAFKQLGAAAELVALQEEVESGQRLYEDLERKLKESSVMAGLKSTQVDIVTKPYTAAKPAEPNTMIFAVVTFFFGSVGSISAAMLRERADRTLKNAYEIEEAIRVPVLGQVPHQLMNQIAQSPANGTQGPAPPVRVFSLLQNNPKSRLTESFRSLGSSLLLSSTRRPKVILVTSALPGEGKSSISLGLATILTQKKARVLLIEADMRRPVFQRSFDTISRKVGLATFLSGTSGFDEAVYQPAEVPSLTILPAGPIPPYPAELLDSRVMADLLNRGREEFDFVVIDTPPLLSVSDALPLTVQADAVLLAVRSRLTRLHALLDTHHLLLRSGKSISGIVLNDVSDLDGGQYYYGYYNSYYEDLTDSRV